MSHARAASRYLSFWAQGQDPVRKNDCPERDREFISDTLEETAWLAVLVVLALGVAAVVLAIVK
jgi:hypothetical protein